MVEFNGLVVGQVPRQNKEILAAAGDWGVSLSHIGCLVKAVRCLCMKVNLLHG